MKPEEIHAIIENRLRLVVREGYYSVDSLKQTVVNALEDVFPLPLKVSDHLEMTVARGDDREVHIKLKAISGLGEEVIYAIEPSLRPVVRLEFSIPLDAQEAQ